MELRDGPLENLSGGGGEGGRAKYKKNIRAKENKMKKIHARQLTLKKFMLTPKNIHTRNLITTKNSCCSKIPYPPRNFSNGPSLSVAEIQAGFISNQY